MYIGKLLVLDGDFCIFEPVLKTLKHQIFNFFIFKYAETNVS